jgi:cell fate regulator YaaT (PSP1 superfamily)
MRYLGEFRHSLDPPPGVGDRVVLRTERGVELGTVVAGVGDDGPRGGLSLEKLQAFIEQNGPDYPFRRGGRILRRANPQDVIDYRHLEQSAREEAVFCREQIAELGLPMRLVEVEHLLGGERIVFYFTSESRVDFRELVRRLAGQYRTRIEMRQVGARDEARLVADYERCGQRCCCQQFLKDLRPVSMRMAKVQKATLDPGKISGRCGRLMCCLRYEDACYEALRRRLPRKSTWVRTAEVVGRVTDTQILTQLVRLTLADGSQQAVANEEILERDVAAPPPPQMAATPPKRAAQRKARAPGRRPEPAKPAEQTKPSEPPKPADQTKTREHPKGGDQPKGGKPSRRRSRRKRRRPAGEAGKDKGQSPPVAGKPQGQRPRRRRKRRGKGGPPGEPSGQ